MSLNEAFFIALATSDARVVSAQAARRAKSETYFACRDETLSQRAEASGSDRLAQATHGAITRGQASIDDLEARCVALRERNAQLAAIAAARATSEEAMVNAEQEATQRELRALQSEGARRSEAAAGARRLAAAKDQLQTLEAQRDALAERCRRTEKSSAQPRTTIAITVPDTDERLGITLALDTRTGQLLLHEVNSTLIVAQLSDDFGRHVAAGDVLEAVGTERFVPFDVIDHDGDHRINFTELKEWSRAHGRDCSDEHIARLEEEYDVDGSGTVSIDEFLEGMGKAELNKMIGLIASSPRPLSLHFSRKVTDTKISANGQLSPSSTRVHATRGEFESAHLRVEDASDVLYSAELSERSSERNARNVERRAATTHDLAEQSALRVRALRQLLATKKAETAALRTELLSAPVAVQQCCATRETLGAVLFEARGRNFGGRDARDAAWKEKDAVELTAAALNHRQNTMDEEAAAAGAATTAARNALIGASERRVHAERCSSSERSERNRLREQELMLAARLLAHEQEVATRSARGMEAVNEHSTLAAAARRMRAQLDAAERELSWLRPTLVRLAGSSTSAPSSQPTLRLTAAETNDVVDTAVKLAELWDHTAGEGPSLTAAELGMTELLRAAIAATNR